MSLAMNYEKIGIATDMVEKAIRDLSLNVNRELLLEDFLLNLRQKNN
jgi:DNA polymerase-3 subunit delta'